MVGANILVGYGLEGDLRLVADSYPLQASWAESPWLGIELAGLRAQAAAGDGLRSLCAELLGGRLNKELQCSDWAARPLSPAQLRYAALDAWVLLPLLRRLLPGTADCDRGGGSLRADDAAVDLGEAQAAASARPPAASEGAAAVVATLRRLDADTARAAVAPDERGGEGSVHCKSLACVLERGGATGVGGGYPGV